jgi:hypothetical protein
MTDSDGTRRYLFVGGPLDGEWRPVTAEQAEHGMEVVAPELSTTWSPGGGYVHVPGGRHRYTVRSLRPPIEKPSLADLLVDSTMVADRYHYETTTGLDLRFPGAKNWRIVQPPDDGSRWRNADLMWVGDVAYTAVQEGPQPGTQTALNAPGWTAGPGQFRARWTAAPVRRYVLADRHGRGVVAADVTEDGFHDYDLRAAVLDRRRSLASKLAYELLPPCFTDGCTGKGATAIRFTDIYRRPDVAVPYLPGQQVHACPPHAHELLKAPGVRLERLPPDEAARDFWNR